MRTRWISKFLICAAMFCLGGVVFATPVNFTLRRGHMIVIPVTINDTGPHDFLLDTGGSTTLVTPEFARQLSLHALDRVELVTVAGAQRLVRSRLNSVNVGGKNATGVEVLISELREVRATVPNIKGVLGQNFMARFNYLIDYGAQRLEFEESTELESVLCGARLPLEERAGQWMVTIPLSRTTARSDPQDIWHMVPDTGTSTLVLFARGEVTLDWALDATEAQLARTDLGSRAAQLRRVRSVQIGPVKFANLPAAVLTTGQAGEERSGTGLLPTSLFQRVYFNHRARYLILNPAQAE